MGLFSSKPKPEPVAPIPMEERPIEYVRFPACKHSADDWDCGCYSWDVQVGSTYGIDRDADRTLLPSKRGATKRTLVLLPDDQGPDDWVPFFSLTNAPIGHANIPKAARLWATSDETRLVFQIWLVVSRTDDEYDKEPYYEAKVRFAKKGELLQFDEGDPLAMLP